MKFSGQEATYDEVQVSFPPWQIYAKFANYNTPIGFNLPCSKMITFAFCQAQLQLQLQLQLELRLALISYNPHQGEFSLVASIKVNFLASVTKNVVLSFLLITLKI